MKTIIPLFSLGTLILFSTICNALPLQHNAHLNPYYRPTPFYYEPPSEAFEPLEQEEAYYSPVFEARENVVRLAYQELGTRYKYGGSNPREGFDCSGLMQYIYKNGAGVHIPRTASQQRNRSRTVQYQNLQVGDMMFFKTSSRTHHVGIYVGNRQFIHAPNRRSRVKLTSIDNRYWHQHFVKFGSYFES
ncbi:MAG: C40 family peptidase [Cocleimonas sp.]|nr:C40 family peptidase [Cocleimonas sp.]